MSATEPVAGPAPTPVVSTTQTAIQATLDRYAALIQAGQPDKARGVADPDQPAVQRVLAEMAAELHQQTRELGAAPGFSALAVRERAPGLAEALVERQWDRRRYHWLFRQAGEQWLLSQPTSDERGEGFTLRYRAWDAALAQQLLPQLVAARQRVLAALTVDDAEPFTVTLRSVLGPGDSGGRGYFAPGSKPERDRIELVTVGVAFGSFAAERSWEQALTSVLAHEYTHRVHTRAPSLQPMHALPSWMSEGLAEHIAGENHLDVPAFRALVAGGQLRSLCELSTADTTTPRGVLYGFSQQAVSYIVEQRGGLAAFWQLAEAYRSTPGGGKERMERALTESWDETCETFDQA